MALLDLFAFFEEEASAVFDRGEATGEVGQVSSFKEVTDPCACATPPSRTAFVCLLKICLQSCMAIVLLDPPFACWKPSKVLF